MTQGVLDDDQRDCLREIANIGMGRAGSAMAQLFGQFVQLDVPHLRIMARSEFPDALEETLPFKSGVTVSRQGFSGPLRGEAVLVLQTAQTEHMADFLGSGSVEEQILDFTGIMTGACFGSVARLLGLDIGWAPPTMLGELDSAAALPVSDTWSQVMLLNIDFVPEKTPLRCHLLIFLADEAIGTTRDAVDRVLDNPDLLMAAAA